MAIIHPKLSQLRLPAPMKVGAFDQPERDSESFDPDMDGDGFEGVEGDEMADDEMA
ncbi:hypothetical protein [Sphingomonas sp. PAMC 26605]|uniref:hypothetical protein n=1 Tax=Sphingomonas sp. PAMC 26605 TaxID=1112214 RepID=UPI000301A48C|nr:hypothetical protein [Sphingomonas sp. PAMC 26605]